MPPTPRALRMPVIPNGAKPPSAVKLEGLKATAISTITARNGIAIFQIMITLLDFARLATPRTFMIVNTP